MQKLSKHKALLVDHPAMHVKTLNEVPITYNYNDAANQ